MESSSQNERQIVPGAVSGCTIRGSRKKTSGKAILLACVFVLPVLASTFGQEQRPNILFVSVDDLNDWIEPLGGHPQAVTPNFTRFMKRSVCFTNTSCPSPGCDPSRTAIMTGLAPYSSNVRITPWT
ncbi:sulfatase-like hydrolase/transferase [Novipirellula herctigrandis]|uniref:sulfatase-like hydrolase/transferase n=1 Tax=Novipirellula herctigrandis TaxID=2527986 RepID=UPI003AF3F055